MDYELESNVQTEVDIILSVRLRKSQTEDEVWEDTWDNRIKQIHAIDPCTYIENIGIDQFVKWIKEAYADDAPALHLSDTFYKAYFFNHNTDRIVVQIALVLAQAYLIALEDALKRPIFLDKIKEALCTDNQKQTYRNDTIKLINDDIDKLKELIKRLEQITLMS